MMKKYLMFLFAVIFCAEMSAAGNLLRDPGFEHPEQWRGLDKTYSFESGSGRNFTGALVCRRSDPRQYSVPCQQVKLIPGKTYRFGVWVKTEGRLSGSGAAVCVEFFTPAGEWVNTITAPEKLTVYLTAAAYENLVLALGKSDSLLNTVNDLNTLGRKVRISR